MPTDPTPGEIVTFYSYKGGTGRTMAVANTAVVLAERVSASERVLVVDWDLEAPGLHKFLPGRLSRNSTTDVGLDGTQGVVDLFLALEKALPDSAPRSEEESDAFVDRAFASLSFDTFIADTIVPRVHIMRAGRNDDGRYPQRAHGVRWEDIFRRAPTIYRRIAEQLGRDFRYALIDSRTGISDISGVCTALLPEKLVVVFTPNRQSLSGVCELVERATEYRRCSDDLRPLLVYPLPSRIDASMEELRLQWRFGSRDLDVVGYQRLFEERLTRAYGLPACDLTSYFDEIQIQHTPDYAYGEAIAVRGGLDRFSLAHSYRIFAERLASGVPPWADATQIATPEGASPGVETGPIAVLPAATEAQARRRVFVCHSEEDRLRVQPVAEALKARGWHVSSEMNLSGGQARVPGVLEAALDDASVIVVCWSRTSALSPSIAEEAAEGLRRGVLLSVRLDDVLPPLLFRGLHSLSITPGNSGGMERLAAAAETVAQGVPAMPAIAEPDLRSQERTPERFLIRLVSALTGVSALFVVSGLVTSVVSSFAYGRLSVVYDQSITEWAFWGSRALVLPIVFLVLAAIVAGATLVTYRLVKKAPVIARGSGFSLARRLGVQIATLGLTPNVLLQSSSAATLFAIAIVVWRFSDVFRAIANISSGDISIAVLAAQASRVTDYRVAMSWTLAIFALCAYASFKAVRRGAFAIPSLALASATGAIGLVLLVAPYRLRYETFERVIVQGRRCSLIGASGSGLVIICPGLAPSTRVVSRNSVIERSDIEATLFDPVD